MVIVEVAVVVEVVITNVDKAERLCYSQKERNFVKCKGRIRGLAYRGSTVAYGSFGIKTMDEGFITSRQIEAARIAITRHMKREGQVWIRIFPDKPMTSKPAEVRMGKGKGAPSHWVAPVRPGRIMFEVDGVQLDTAKEALRLGAQKLPVRCKLVTRPDLAGK